MKLIIFTLIFIVSTSIMSCSNAEHNHDTHGKNATVSISDSTKEVNVSPAPTLIEVTLDKGGQIIFAASSNLEYFKNKQLLEHVTVYRRIRGTDCGCTPDAWKIDRIAQVPTIDSTLIFYDDDNDDIVKIEYRQGFISKILDDAPPKK